MSEIDLGDNVTYNPETGEAWTTRPNRWGTPQPKRPIKAKGGWGYIILRYEGKAIALHRLVAEKLIGVPDGMCVDHIDGIRDNNRLANLRVVTVAENAQKMKLKGTHLPGYQRTRQGKFRANIDCMGRIYLGTYDTEEEAHEAYMAAKRKLHGELAANYVEKLVRERFLHT